MEHEIPKLLLNGLSVNAFIAFFIWGAAGGILSFAYSVRTSIKQDTTTPTTWSWKHFTKGFWRLLTAAIALAAGIIFSEEILGFLLSSDSPVELNMWSAFLSGLALDRSAKKFISLTQSK